MFQAQEARQEAKEHAEVAVSSFHMNHFFGNSHSFSPLVVGKEIVSSTGGGGSLVDRYGVIKRGNQ